MARAELVRAVGEVLQQIDVHVEGEQEGLVLLPQHLLKKLAAGLLLERQHALLAAGGVEQNAEGERQVGLGDEVLEGLRQPCLPATVQSSW